LTLACVKVDFELCLFKIFISLGVSVFARSFKSSKNVLCVEIMKTPNNKYWATGPKSSYNDSLPDAINVAVFSYNIRKKQGLCPKYENTDATSKSIKGNSWL